MTADRELIGASLPTAVDGSSAAIAPANMRFGLERQVGRSGLVEDLDDVRRNGSAGLGYRECE